jgi:hypothetical protein
MSGSRSKTAGIIAVMGVNVETGCVQAVERGRLSLVVCAAATVAEAITSAGPSVLVAVWSGQVQTNC